MDEFTVDSVWKHKESGKFVRVVSTGKQLSDSHWIHSITYEVEGKMGAFWTRSQESFRIKFTPT